MIFAAFLGFLIGYGCRLVIADDRLADARADAYDEGRRTGRLDQLDATYPARARATREAGR